MTSTPPKCDGRVSERREGETMMYVECDLSSFSTPSLSRVFWKNLSQRGASKAISLSIFFFTILFACAAFLSVWRAFSPSLRIAVNTDKWHNRNN